VPKALCGVAHGDCVVELSLNFSFLRHFLWMQLAIFGHPREGQVTIVLDDAV